MATTHMEMAAMEKNTLIEVNSHFLLVIVDYGKSI
jgi:hypothetical protein